MKLGDYAEPLAYEIAFWMEGFADPDYPLDQLGDLCLELSGKLRAVGIILLLTQADSDGFHHNLIRGARARSAYLERCVAESATAEHHFASGRFEPLLNAVAAGDFGLARRIDELSPADFRAGHEYEDDYCYAQLLHRLARKDVPEDELGPLLERWEAFADDAPSARLSVCRVLAESNGEAFEEAFEELLDERETAIQTALDDGELEEPQVVAERQVWIEALALLRLAARRGIEPEREHRYAPSLARAPMKTPFPGE